LGFGVWGMGDGGWDVWERPLCPLECGRWWSVALGHPPTPRKRGICRGLEGDGAITITSKSKIKIKIRSKIRSKSKSKIKIKIKSKSKSRIRSKKGIGFWWWGLGAFLYRESRSLGERLFGSVMWY
jgi:hypothetical protein